MVALNGPVFIVLYCTARHFHMLHCGYVPATLVYYRCSNKRLPTWRCSFLLTLVTVWHRLLLDGVCGTPVVLHCFATS